MQLNAGHPDKRFIEQFIQRHPELKIWRSANLKQARAKAMTSTSLAIHFSLLIKVYEEYSITSGKQFFIVDKSRFSTRKAGREIAEASIRAENRSNLVKLD